MASADQISCPRWSNKISILSRLRINAHATYGVHAHEPTRQSQPSLRETASRTWLSRPSSVQASRICDSSIQWHLHTGSRLFSATVDACCMPSHPDEMRSVRPTRAYLFESCICIRSACCVRSPYSRQIRGSVHPLQYGSWSGSSGTVSNSRWSILVGW